MNSCVFFLVRFRRLLLILVVFLFFCCNIHLSPVDGMGVLTAVEGGLFAQVETQRRQM